MRRPCGSLRYLAKQRPDQTFHGFDSFEGLPEHWYNFPRGGFNRKGCVPRVPGNVLLHKGWFEETLPAWIKSIPDVMAFMHIDCDLYSSTKTVFNCLGNRIKPGVIIVFDEYFGYPGWEHHEFKAFQEFVKLHDVQYEYLCYAAAQVAIRILEVRSQ